MGYQKKKKRSARCPECQARFTTARDNQVYCDPKCKWKAWDKAHPRQK